MCIPYAPVTLQGLVICLDKIFGQRQHHGNGMLRNGSPVCARSDHNGNAQLCCLRNVYRIIPDAGPPDDLQLWAAGQSGCITLSDADDQGIRILHQLGIVIGISVISADIVNVCLI